MRADTQTISIDAAPDQVLSNLWRRSRLRYGVAMQGEQHRCDDHTSPARQRPGGKAIGRCVAWADTPPAETQADIRL